MRRLPNRVSKFALAFAPWRRRFALRFALGREERGDRKPCLARALEGSANIEPAQLRNANSQALVFAERKPPGPSMADRKPLSRLTGGSQTAEPSDGRIANSLAPGWADRKPLGPPMGGSQTAGLGRDTNPEPGLGRNAKPLHAGATQTVGPGLHHSIDKTISCCEQW